MSLRSDVHDAIDEVAPPAPMLAHQVIAFVLTEGHERRGSSSRRRWTVRWGDGAGMVAAVLIVSVVATVLVGGRLWREWNAVGYRPAVMAQLETLEARPRVILPTVRPGDPCPAGPYNQVQNLIGLEQPQVSDNATTFGGGPAYQWEPGISRSVVHTDWGAWIETNFFADPTSSGLMLFRAWDLQTGQQVVFAENPFADQTRNDGFPAGDAAGRATYVGYVVQTFPMLVIDPSHRSDRPLNRKGFFEINVLVGYPKGTSDCTQYQVDGPNFTEVFVVSHS